MGILTELYRNYIKKYAERNQNFISGEKQMEELQYLLNQKLNLKDYNKADELLLELISIIQKESFISGAKSIYQLGQELAEEKNID